MVYYDSYSSFRHREATTAGSTHTHVTTMLLLLVAATRTLVMMTRAHDLLLEAEY